MALKIRVGCSLALPLILVWFESIGQPSIKDLELLIGTWTVEEVQTDGPLKGWTEKGTRTCSYVLNDSYIQCETVAVSSDKKERSYRMMINYNKMTAQFEMIGLYSNWPLKPLDVLTVDKGNKRITLISGPHESSDRNATIQFSDDDHYSWTGRNISKAKPGQVTVFTETGKRK